MISTYVIHIPTDLFLNYCFWPEPTEIHCVLSKTAPPRRNSFDMLNWINDYRITKFIIHNNDDIYFGSPNEFMVIRTDV